MSDEPDNGLLVRTPSQPASPRIRPRTIRATRLTGSERRSADLVVYPDDVARPKVRGECVNGPRPCPWVSCRHHLYLQVSSVGAIKLNFPHLEVDELEQTCALDVADGGGETLERVGKLLNLTRERIRQVEVKGCEAMRRQIAAQERGERAA